MARPNLAWLVPATVTGSLVPFVWIAIGAARHQLGPNPIASALNQLGLLALIFLTGSLSCTPLKLLSNWNWPLRVRRTLGLFGFFSASAHFLLYLVLDQSLSLPAVLRDVVKRPFIALGASALVLLVPLAWTSSKRALARLGFARWKALHRLAYLIGALGVAHFYLRVKADHTQPLIYGALIAFGFGLRAIARYTRARQQRSRATLRAARSSSA